MRQLVAKADAPPSVRSDTSGEIHPHTTGNAVSVVMPRANPRRQHR
jgi:hypothetical protein